MDDQRLGVALRAIRRRRRMRQKDVADASGTSQDLVSVVERGQVEGTTIRSLRRLAAALDARLVIGLQWRGGELDWLLDQRHAGLLEAAVVVMGRLGWDEVRVEVSYSEYGERGSIDLLGWQERNRALAVGEVKSELASLEAMARKHDEKARLAPRIALRRFGWRAHHVGRVLVLPDDSTARRQVVRHHATFDALLPGRTIDVRRWLKDPASSFAGIWFLAETSPGRRIREMGSGPGGPRRIRLPRPSVQQTGKER